MKPAKTYIELEKQVLNALIKTIQNEIAKFIREWEQLRIDIDVYDYYDSLRGGYNPSPNGNDYERTYQLRKDIQIQNTSSGAVIANESHTSEILNIIESGDGYSWNNSLIFKLNLPRPFFHNTITDIEDGLLYSDIKEILIKKGFKIY